VSCWITPVVLSDSSRALVEVLERYTAFPWAFVVTACKRACLDPARLEHHHIAELIQPLSLQLAALSDVDRAFELKRALTMLSGGVLLTG
jgi:hypothetical protein